MHHTSLRLVARVALVAPLLAFVLNVHCGTDAAPFVAADGGLDGAASGDATTTSDDGASPDGPVFGDAAATCFSVGAGCTSAAECCVSACNANVCGGAATSADGAPGSGQKACNLDGGPCVKGFDCCSGTCNGGKCQGNALGNDGGPGAAGSCLAPTASCTQSAQCCSGLCEPVTGQAGVIECRDACRADGVACTSAQDCCSLGCFGGVCTNKLCSIVGDPCASNAECCSGVCNSQTHQCDVDLANSTCRPTGEDCGKGPQSGCCGATDKNDLCGPDGRCILPPGACRGEKAACTTDADCCSNHCDPGTHTCTTPCVPAAGACTTGADCCTSSCTNGSCDAPVPPPPPPPPPGTDAGGTTGTDAGTPPVPICAAIGTACTASAQCCSGLCLAGFCDFPVR